MHLIPRPTSHFLAFFQLKMIVCQKTYPPLNYGQCPKNPICDDNYQTIHMVDKHGPI